MVQKVILAPFWASAKMQSDAGIYQCSGCAHNLRKTRAETTQQIAVPHGIAWISGKRPFLVLSFLFPFSFPFLIIKVFQFSDTLSDNLLLKKEPRTRDRPILIPTRRTQHESEPVLNPRPSACFETWEALSTSSYLRTLLYWNYDIYEVPSSISRAFEPGSVAFSDAMAYQRGTIAIARAFFLAPSCDGLRYYSLFLSAACSGLRQYSQFSCWCWSLIRSFTTCRVLQSAKRRFIFNQRLKLCHMPAW